MNSLTAGHERRPTRSLLLSASSFLVSGHDPQKARGSIQRLRNLSRPATVLASFPLPDSLQRAGPGWLRCTDAHAQLRRESFEPKTCFNSELLAIDRSTSLWFALLIVSGNRSQTIAPQDHHASCTHTHRASDCQTEQRYDGRRCSVCAFRNGSCNMLQERCCYEPRVEQCCPERPCSVAGVRRSTTWQDGDRSGGAHGDLKV